MSKRDHLIHFMVTEDEYAGYRKKAETAGLPVAEFIREAAAGSEVRGAPEAEVALLIAEVRRMGAYMEDLLMIAGKAGLQDETEMIRAALEENRTVEKRLLEAYGV